MIHDRVVIDDEQFYPKYDLDIIYTTIDTFNTLNTSVSTFDDELQFEVLLSSVSMIQKRFIIMRRILSYKAPNLCYNKTHNAFFTLCTHSSKYI
jgi:hypothetical protein